MERTRDCQSQETCLWRMGLYWAASGSADLCSHTRRVLTQFNSTFKNGCCVTNHEDMPIANGFTEDWTAKLEEYSYWKEFERERYERRVAFSLSLQHD